MNSNFYKTLNDSEKELLKKYFIDLNNSISLSKKDTKSFNEYFEKAIEYYYKKN